MGMVRLMVLMHNPPRCLPHPGLVSRTRQQAALSHESCDHANRRFGVGGHVKDRDDDLFLVGVLGSEGQLLPPVFSQHPASCLIRLRSE